MAGELKIMPERVFIPQRREETTELCGDFYAFISISSAPLW
jgi:hypothetical protein